MLITYNIWYVRQIIFLGGTMYSITNIVLIKKIDDCVWNVVFQMDHEPLEFTTDFLYLIKENKWVFNSLLTHELTSLMEGHICVYCKQDKIACFVASAEYEKVKVEIVENETFLNQVWKDTGIAAKEVSSDYLVVNNKEKWLELANENRFYFNLNKIQTKQ